MSERQPERGPERGPERQPTGIRIRERRQERGLRQAELAASVGISPSYLNLIEHGRRRIGGKLLGDIARALDLDPAALGEGPDRGRLQALRAAVAGVAEIARIAPEMSRAQDFADRFPGWAALVSVQGTRIAALERRVTELSGRLSHDRGLAQALHRVLSGVTSIRATSSILVENPDLDRDWRDRFLRNILADSEGLAESSRALVRFLEAPESVAPEAASPREAAGAWLDARDHHLPEAEAGGMPDDLPEGPAGRIVLDWAARYAEDAAALPLAAFAGAAREEAHDPARLARRFRAPIDRVLRRLAALPAGQGHPATGLAICDASGTLLHLKALDGADLPRAGACPLWPLFEALAQPGRALRAHAALPGEDAPRFLCHAVASRREEPDWGRPPLVEATMLLTPAPPDPASPDPAPPNPAPDDRLVGPTCRLCPRDPCPARREPSILA
ncbi:XRE family transcriptional regulator [Rubellimicrobium aerolatum]|uniref:Helix-turn-helix domain-containing protein n=1 Tax=Rubellimicrobium aerolatum TaxID=490979 RepID=A0ABW0S5W4_9RHOB|nr:XRE family transcriptional regulator [Rubellimicrobium aerolatum]MBP1804541.1 transcriptional regulator with XRE-family HTH domain [Rubellimicrobium aerolatum]